MSETTKSIISTIAAILTILLLKPLLIMWLWNWVAVAVFGLPHITFWAAFGLNWLISLLAQGINLKGKSNK